MKKVVYFVIDFSHLLENHILMLRCYSVTLFSDAHTALVYTFSLAWKTTWAKTSLSSRVWVKYKGSRKSAKLWYLCKHIHMFLYSALISISECMGGGLLYCIIFLHTPCKCQSKHMVMSHHIWSNLAFATEYWMTFCILEPSPTVLCYSLVVSPRQGRYNTDRKKSKFVLHHFRQ